MPSSPFNDLSFFAPGERIIMLQAHWCLCWLLTLCAADAHIKPWRRKLYVPAFVSRRPPLSSQPTPSISSGAASDRRQPDQPRQERQQGRRRKTLWPAVALSQPSSSCDQSTVHDIQHQLFNQFRGLFDNADQVREERAAGMGPGPEGGHEQIHCKLEVLDLPSGVLNGALHLVGATYYFDDNPEAVFRCRVYSFHEPSAGTTTTTTHPGERDVAEMRLMRFTPDFETLLRSKNYDLKALLPREAEEVDKVLEPLEGCEIVWSRGEGAKASFVGRMRHGGCTVQSQRTEGLSLWIEDELRLEGNTLEVNDRGFDCETKALVYGNHEGAPYRLERRTLEVGEGEGQEMEEHTVSTNADSSHDDDEGLEWDEDKGIFNCVGDECSLDWMWDDEEEEPKH